MAKGQRQLTIFWERKCVYDFPSIDHLLNANITHHTQSLAENSIRHFLTGTKGAIDVVVDIVAFKIRVARKSGKGSFYKPCGQRRGTVAFLTENCLMRKKSSAPEC